MFMRPLVHIWARRHLCPCLEQKGVARIIVTGHSFLLSAFLLFAGPQICFSGYAGVGSGGEQGLHHFLPPHTRRVSFIIIVLPVIVRSFLKLFSIENGCEVFNNWSQSLLSLSLSPSLPPSLLLSLWAVVGFYFPQLSPWVF